jgi:hypothetical protein
MEARGGTTLAIPQKTPGAYTVVLELFYPAYKGGSAQKGEFKAVSNVVHFRVLAGARPADPVKVVLVEPPRPAFPAAGKAALVIQCGKGEGKQQDELIFPKFGYKLVKGGSFAGWPKGEVKTHCWYDPKEVRFELVVPPRTTGTLRLFFVDGGDAKRKQRISVQGKARGDLASFAGPGKKLEVLLTAAEVISGKVDVSVENLNLAANAVVSTVEFIPTAR